MWPSGALEVPKAPSVTLGSVNGMQHYHLAVPQSPWTSPSPLFGKTPYTWSLLPRPGSTLTPHTWLVPWPHLLDLQVRIACPQALCIYGLHLRLKRNLMCQGHLPGLEVAWLWLFCPAEPPWLGLPAPHSPQHHIPALSSNAALVHELQAGPGGRRCLQAPFQTNQSHPLPEVAQGCPQRGRGVWGRFWASLEQTAHGF